MTVMYFVTSKERGTSALLADPGFTLESVEFLVGGKLSNPGKATAQQFSFTKCKYRNVLTWCIR